MDRIEWKPNGKQKKFLEVPFTVKEAFYGGGAGSGKSDVLLMYGIVHRFHENPRFKQVFMRRTHTELRNEIVPRSREIYSKFGATFNKTEMIWTFPRLDQYGGTGLANAGAIILLGHCENESDVHNYDSMEISLFTPDEITSLTEYIYLYIAFERNRSPKDSGLPSITRAAGMPGNIGHTFTKKRFVDPSPEGGKIIIGKGGNKRIYIHSTLIDNKEHVDPTYEQSLRGRPDAEMKAKLYGDWNAYLGQVFEEFRDRHYPDEPDNAVHVIPSFTVPEWWPKFVIGDWGFTAMTYIGYYTVSPSRRLYLYREQNWIKTKIREWAPYVKEYIDKEKPRMVKFCKSAGQDRGQDQTIQQQISEALGIPIELSNNSAGSRIAGKQLIHEYLRWKPSHLPVHELPPYDNERAMWILRNRGLEEYKSYVKMYDSIELHEQNIPRLQIFDDCQIMIGAIKACSYDKPKNNKPAEDVAEFDGDDPYDDLRYAVDTAEQYMEEAEEEFKKIQKQSEILVAMQNSQDMTSYYRNMRTLESLGATRGLRRYK